MLFSVLFWVLESAVFLLEETSCEDVLRGPSFLHEPPSKVTFSNSSGTVIQCSAIGVPQPTISWVGKSGARIVDIPSIRQIRSDGSLVFFPFRAEEYRQDVHAAIYRCVASNSIGKIGSRDVHIRGVVRQNYTPKAYDEFVMLGNAAVLRCHVPTYVSDYVSVVSWQRDDGYVIGISDNKGGAYTVLQSGELYVHNVELAESGRKFRCQTHNRFHGDLTYSSSSGQLIVTASHGTISPKITFIRPQVTTEEGSSAELVCAAQGQPPPTYRWYKEEFGQLVTLKEDKRIWVNRGIVTIRNVALTDAGKYYCFAGNTNGEEKAETVLIVSAPISVSVTPAFQVLAVGQQTHLNCTVKGYPIHSVVWMRDLQRLAATTRIRMLSRELLHISSIQREDKGMYQCFAYNEHDSAQGTSELSLGDSSPVILGAFSSRTLHPGEHLSLTCIVSGSPLPVVRWSIDEQRVSSNLRISVGDFNTPQGEVHSYLNISSVRVEDGGKYRCEATNEIGSIKHEAVVNIHGPLFERPMRNVSVVSGTDFLLNCPVGGYPIEKIKWKKGGIVLPLNNRQEVDPAWHLRVKAAQPGADNGEYVCVASNLAGQTASGRMYVNVIVAPVIDDHFFPNTISAEEGSRTRIICSVSKGDPPLKIKWLKDGLPLLPHSDMGIHSLEDSSTISFRRVSSTDHGQYTCLVSNNGASTNKSLQLIVNVQPIWKVEPMNSSAVLGKRVSIDCDADGYPVPTITWRKSKGSDPSDFMSIYSNSRNHVLNNGTLQIDDIDDNDEGFYLCQAHNGIGGGISKVIFLKVHTPPRFDAKYKTLAVQKDEDAVLECQVTGEKPITIVWSKNRQKIKPSSRFSIQIKTSDSEESSILTISSASRQDSSVYSCEASNQYGSDESNIQLLVQEVPESPVNVTVANKTSRTAFVKWTPGFNGNSALLHYVLQYQRAKVPGGPPTNVRVQSTGSQSLKVTWQPPSEELQYGKIIGYYVGYKEADSQDQYQYKHVEVTDSNSADNVLSTYLTNLQRLTQYSVVVQAHNAAGPGPRSDEVLATTLETAPPTSPVVTVSSVTSSSIGLRWEKDLKDGSVLTEYVLHYKTEGGLWQEQRIDGTSNGYVLENLRCGTRYRIYLTAANSLGTGEPSEIITVSTKGAAPVSPPATTLISVNSTTITLNLNSWQSGGCPIQYFKVSYRHKFQRQWSIASDHVPQSQGTFEIRQLFPGREYNLLVTAHNEAGVTQAEYDFRTANLVMLATATPTPAWSKSSSSSIPFPKNLTLLLPVIVSIVVVVSVIIAVAACLRRHFLDSSSRESSDSQLRKRAISEHYSMSEISQKLSNKLDNTGRIVLPAGTREPVHLALQRPYRNTHEYAEPYTAPPQSPRSGPGENESRTPSVTGPQRSASCGPFATIKRNACSSGGRTSVQETKIIAGHQVILPERSEYSSLSSQSEGSTEKGSSHSSGSRKPLQ